MKALAMATYSDGIFGNRLRNFVAVRTCLPAGRSCLGHKPFRY